MFFCIFKTKELVKSCVGGFSFAVRSEFCVTFFSFSTQGNYHQKQSVNKDLMILRLHWCLLQYSESRISTFFFISRLKPDKNRFQNNLKCQMVAKWVTFGNLAKKFEILAQYGLEAEFCLERRSLKHFTQRTLLLINNIKTKT